MRLVFMGTPDFAVPSLQALVRAGHEVLAVFTQPDRPAGRGKNLRPSPVKTTAQELGLPIFQPEKIKNNKEVFTLLHELNPECIIVVAYGQILPREILNLPPRGCINVHASLLPSYRGAAPIHWAVINGEKTTGVTTMLMDEGLDTGDMLLKKEYSIPENATTGEVHDVLARLGAELLLETLEKLVKGELQPVPQTGSSNYAPLLRREHEIIDWNRSALEIHNQIRGLNPWPGAYTTFRGENIKVWQSLIPKDSVGTGSLPLECYNGKATVPGEVLKVVNEGLLIQTGNGVLLVTEVQPAGKRQMPARNFFLGRHAKPGEYFGR